MSEVKKLRPVSKAELAAKGVSALSDRPNTRKQYGVGGLTAQELKAWFDKLSVFLAEKINEIHDTISEDGASDYIKIDTDDADIATLGDLVRSIYSGYLSERALNVSVPGLTSGTLRYVLTRLKQDISLNAENINTLMENAGVRISSATSGNTVTVRLTNSTGKVLAFITLDLTATTDRIADGAVTMPKIAVKSLSTDAFADQSVSTRTIQPKAVTEDKLSPELLLKLASLAGGALSGVSFDPATNRITVTNAAGHSFSAELVFDSSSIDADPKGTAKQAVSEHNADTSAHADLRKIVSELAQRLSAIADSDDGTLDQLSEIVAYIKNNKNLIENITTSKVSYADIVNDLVTGGEKKALSAAQGVKIKALIDGLDRDKASHAELASELERLLEEAKESGEFDGESISIVSTQESSGSGGINVITFSDGSKLNVKNGYTPYIGENGNWYIGNVDTTIKAKGENGKSITVSSVTESTESGGNNVVTFSDGKDLTVKNGKDGSNGKTPQKGVDYLGKEEAEAYIASELAKRGQLKPENAQSLEWLNANGDTSKFYVLMDKTSPDYGYIFAYMRTQVWQEGCTNLVPTSTVSGGGSIYNGTGYKYGYRYNSGGEEKALDNTATFGFIPVTKNSVIRIKWFAKGLYSQFNGSGNHILLYDSSYALLTTTQQGLGSALKSNGIGSMDDQTHIYTVTASDILNSDAIAFMKFSTALNSSDESDIAQVIVTVDEEIKDGGYVDELGWASTGHAFVPADYEDRIVDLEEKTSDHDKRLVLLEATEDEAAVPSYWLDELKTKAETIQLAMETAGRSKSAFLWYTDAHWQTNAKVSPALMRYLCKNTPMNKVNFGGDIINDPNPHNHDNTKYVYEWRKMISDLPNHHSVFGNHDVNHRTTDVGKMAYAQVIAPEESSDMVVGGDSYYYIDNPSEKTRYLYLSYTTTGIGLIEPEAKFIAESLNSVQEGWHVVAIAHRWWQYTSASAPTTGSVPSFEKEVLEIFDAYNARTSRNATSYFEAQDFTNAKGKVEFCIGGHIHIDYDFTSTGGIPVIITASDTNQERVSNETEDSGTLGTITESAVFGIIADYNTDKITVVGVGRGTSREITY